jgi:hypothetical protein
MKRQQAIKAWGVKRILIALVAAVAATVSCQNNGQGLDSRVTSSQDNGNTEVKQVINRGGQNNNQEGANRSDQTTGNVAGTDAKKPSIKITDVPSKGAGPDTAETIAGTVGGVNVNECKVVIFARTDVWYVQPYTAAPDTQIRADGTWQSDTHLGSEYAALLVKNSYKPPATTGTLPGVSGAVLAIDRAAAKN